MSSLKKIQLEPRLVDLILRNVADGVFTVDPDFRITFINPAAEAIAGFSSRDVLGTPCNEVFRTPICGKDCPLRQSLGTGRRVSDFEIDIRTRKGRMCTVSVSTSPLIDDNGRFIGGVETFRDLSPLKQLQSDISDKHTFQDVVSKNARMRELLRTLPNIAHSDAPVLIQGHAGTGKNLLATAIHNLGPRAGNPFLRASCGALPESLEVSELFGRRSGAEDPNRRDLVGRIEAARGGTLYLDEVGEFPLSVQSRLMRLIEEGVFEPLDSPCAIEADVRIIASSTGPLDRMVAEGKFREDLYYRLNVLSVRLPELRDRREDIPLLVDFFIRRFNLRRGRRKDRVTDECMAVLMRYPFSGNVRELENAIEHAHIVSRGPLIRLADLPPHIVTNRRSSTGSLRRPTRRGTFWKQEDLEFERERLTEALERNAWNIPRTAEEMGIHRTTLWRQVRQLKIDRA